MDSEVVIRVEGLGKRYTLGASQKDGQYTALRDVVAEKAKALIRRPFNRHANRDLQAPATDFWALKDVSFEVRRGEVLGIIGRNGAGKSTLLKILSRITEPTEGRIKLHGRVASLLEVGTGFHPELTGRENIFLNGAILGMHRAEIKAKFDEIVAFAEVEKFLDTPVKRYSSGMYVRLAFAVAAHLEPEILIVDEVLAVGDAEFQKKCLGKMENVAHNGRTVLVVSHNWGQIRCLCTSGLSFEKGQVSNRGDIETVIENCSRNASTTQLSDCRFDGPLRESIRFEKIMINGLNPYQNEIVVSPHTSLKIELEYEVLAPFEGRITIALFSEGMRIVSAFDCPAHIPRRAGRWIALFRWPERFLRPHMYSVAVGGYAGSKHGPYVWGTETAFFRVGAEWTDDYEERAEGLVNAVPVVEYRCL